MIGLCGRGWRSIDEGKGERGMPVIDGEMNGREMHVCGRECTQKQSGVL